VKRWFLGLSAVTAALALLFLAFPGIDIAVEGAFLKGADGRFLLGQSDWARAVNATVPWHIVLLAAVLAALGARALVARPIGGIGWRQIGYVVAVFLVGPGLLANVLLKDQLGRARPRQVDAHPELSLFTPPFVPSDACPKNCSFPAGDASAGFAFLAVALVLPRRWRPIGVAGALALGTFHGGVRMLQGAHYFSDVIFAALLMALVAIGLHWLMFSRTAGPDSRAGSRAT
jgi:lipid A 4'-phosphatase